jgi:hypothetical protein
MNAVPLVVAQATVAVLAIVADITLQGCKTVGLVRHALEQHLVPALISLVDKIYILSVVLANTVTAAAPALTLLILRGERVHTVVLEATKDALAVLVGHAEAYWLQIIVRVVLVRGVRHVGTQAPLIRVVTPHAVTVALRLIGTTTARVPF